MTPILECKGLSKQYNHSALALDNLNLILERGQIVGLLGPNGSGKTTLIKLINDTLVPTSGEVLISGMKPGVETKKIVSYLPERTYLDKSMKVKDITEKDINEIYEFREILETEAFRRIFELGKAEEYSYRIEEKVVRMCAAAGDNYEWEIADTNMHLEIISIFDNERITHAYQSNLAECIRMGVSSVRHGMEIRKTNQNLKKMVDYMRKNDYKNAFEILKADHFGTGKSSALSQYQKF